METQNDSKIISDLEFIALLNSARHKDTASMMKLVELYKEDILHISKFIRLPAEDAVSTITLEFLEFILDSNTMF